MRSLASSRSPRRTDMDFAAATFDEGLRLVAERLTAMRTKQAQDLPIEQAQRARRHLGYLGTDPKVIDEAVGGVRKGTIHPSVAQSMIRGATPSVQWTKAIPSAGVAFQQGEPGEGLAQLDVLGLRHLTNPAIGIPSALGLGSGLMAANAAEQNARQRAALMGTLGEKEDPLMKRLGGGEKPPRGPRGAAPPPDTSDLALQRQALQQYRLRPQPTDVTLGESLSKAWQKKDPRIFLNRMWEGIKQPFTSLPEKIPIENKREYRARAEEARKGYIKDVTGPYMKD